MFVSVSLSGDCPACGDSRVVPQIRLVAYVALHALTPLVCGDA